MAVDEQAFYEKVAAVNANPLWKLHTQEGARPTVKPHAWRWQTMRELLYEAGELPSLKGQGERRALVMSNPGLKPLTGTTKTLSAAYQIVWPGEIAEAHRHTPAAIRFVIEGHGAFTVQDGERFRMDAGDLTLTPSFCWHDHNNPTNEPVIWLDCLDAPLAGYLDASFFEPFPEDVQPVTRPVGYTNASMGNGLMRPRGGFDPGKTLPITYKWADAYGALLAYDQASRFDGVAMEYANPVTAGHTMPTIACTLQRLRPGEHTDCHRHTSTVLYHVAKGSGYSVIGGMRIDWSKGDTFVLPSWYWHEHANASDEEDAVLFSLSDIPVLESVGLYREEEGPRQEITEVFEG